MPRVPTYDEFRAQPSGPSNATFATASGPTAGAIQADQAQQFGQAASRAGDAAMRIATDIQEQANQVRVIDAVNRAKERMFDLQYGQGGGYANLKGNDALQRPDGKALPDEYLGKFKEATDSIAQELGNDAQRNAFMRVSGDMAAQLYGHAEAHVAQEFRTYQGSVYDGASANAQRQIALNYADVQKGGLVDQGVQTIEAAVRSKARLLGASQEFADNQVREAVSRAHTLAIKTALERNDIGFADGYLKKYKDGMQADDLLAVQGAITKEMDQRQAVSAATGVVSTLAPKIQPSDFDRMVGITLQSESGGQRYGKDGQLLTSPKGAKGEMQVLDSTNRDPGFGVKPAKDNSPEERARVGRDYLAAMAKRYDGDPAKVWAAYNGGPGAVDTAVMRAKASPTPGADWLTFMPNETQAYVAKNVKALQTGLGAAPPTLADVHDQVRARLGASAKPQVVQAALQEATRQWDDQTKAKTQRDEQSVADAQRIILANNGDVRALPPSLRNALPPGKVDDLMGFADRIAKGQQPQTDWGLYYRLTSDQALLKATNLGALRDKLADSEFKQLTEHQAKLNNPSDAQTTQLQGAKDVLSDYMKQAGMNPSPKYDDKRGAAAVGELTARFQQRITAREQALGKKLDTAQLREEAAALFTPVKVPGLIWDSERPAGTISATDRVVVPQAERAQIVAALKRAGRPTDDAAIEAMYRAHNRIPQRTAQN